MLDFLQNFHAILISSLRALTMISYSLKLSSLDMDEDNLGDGENDQDLERIRMNSNSHPTNNQTLFVTNKRKLNERIFQLSVRLK